MRAERQGDRFVSAGSIDVERPGILRPELVLDDRGGRWAHIVRGIGGENYQVNIFRLHSRPHQRVPGSLDRHIRDRFIGRRLVSYFNPLIAKVFINITFHHPAELFVSYFPFRKVHPHTPDSRKSIHFHTPHDRNDT